MDILILLVPLSLVIVGLIAWVMLWAARSGQFDDLEGPAHSVLMDDDSPRAPARPPGEDAPERDTPKA